MADRADAPSILTANRVQDAPHIDGVLGDPRVDPASGRDRKLLSYNPLHGDAIPQQTRVWVAYDSDALFLFQCDDPEPGRYQDLRLSATTSAPTDGRTEPRSDGHRTALVSHDGEPGGVQLDMLNSVAGNEDASVDWV